VRSLSLRVSRVPVGVRGLAVDALALDSKVDARAFVEQAGTSFPIAFDTAAGDVATRYGVRGLPATFFIDREGVVRKMNLGPVLGDLLPAGIAAADAGAQAS
jgi:peroxiredoxin